MNYTVLARKYRSQTFSDLIGQPVLVKTLTAAIESGHLAHAYVLTGIRGTGKTSTARILAKALNCAKFDKPTATPCGECENCKAIAAGQFIDVMEINAADSTGVDEVRVNIIGSAQYAPTNGRYKIFIIDEVHMLSNSAFNALLKILEEPPEYVVFILATTEINEIPITILSRCQRFDLARVPADILKKHYLEIAKKEGVELSEIAAGQIAKAADGSVRDGLSILDQAIAQTGGKITDNSVSDMLKRADPQMISDFMRMVFAGDDEGALKKSDDAWNSGADMSLLLGDMMEWTHWATRMKIAPGTMAGAPFTPDQLESMKAVVADVSLNSLSRAWQVMVAATAELKNAGNPKQNFDMLLVRLVNLAGLPPISQILEQAGKAEKLPKKPCTPATLQPCSLEKPTDLLAVLSADKELSLLSEYNNHCSVSEFAPNKIKISYNGTDQTFITKLKTYLKTRTGSDWEIILDEAKPEEPAPSVATARQTELAGDPLVADALDLFDGAQVVSIK